jgi:NIMA (never in mitosis gene a)-related kinase
MINKYIQNQIKPQLHNFTYHYTILNELGRGAFSIVYKVKSNTTGKIFCVKKIRIPSSSSESNANTNEIKILQKIQSHLNKDQVTTPHLVQYYDSYIENGYMFIVMEYCEYGDLYSLLRSVQKHHLYIQEDILWDISYQTLLALEYLHSKGVIHRDIKLLNIFMNKDKEIKIGDMGMSKIIEGDVDNMNMSRVGTPLFLAPELVKKEKYDYKIDVWSLGCSLYHLAKLVPPFNEDNLIKLGNAIVNSKPKELPHVYSQEFKVLVNALLVKDKNKRVSAKEAIELYIPEKVKMKYKEKMRKRKKKDGGDGDVKDVVNDNNCNNSNNGVSNSNNDNREHVNASDVNSNNVNKQEELFRKSQIGSAGMFIRKQLHMQQTQRKFNMHRKTLKNFTKLSTTTQENFIRITNKTNISRHLNDNNNNNNNNSNSNNSNNNNNQPIQLQTPLNISNNNTNNQTENQRYLPPSQPKTTTNTIINQKIQTLNSFFNHTNTFNHNINTNNNTTNKSNISPKHISLPKIINKHNFNFPFTTKHTTKPINPIISHDITSNNILLPKDIPNTPSIKQPITSTTSRANGFFTPIELRRTFISGKSKTSSKVLTIHDF